MTTTTVRSLRPLITAALLCLLTLTGAPAAQAHDALTATRPADGETITTDPGEVVLTFTQPPTEDVAGANTIEVTAPDGHVISTGEPTVDGSELRVDAAIDHPGEHTVVWRAVSADGHPIEGRFAFTYAPAGSASTPAQETTAGADAAPAEAATSASTEQGSSTGVLLTVAALIVVLVGIAAYLLGRRNRTNTGA